MLIFPLVLGGLASGLDPVTVIAEQTAKQLCLFCSQKVPANYGHQFYAVIGPYRAKKKWM